MVVTMVLGILMSMSLPVFLGAKQRSEDRAAQARLRSAVAAVKIQFTDNGSYAGVTPASLTAIEPSLVYNASVPAGLSQISVRDVSSTHVLMVTASASGQFVCVADDVTTSGLSYGKTGADTYVLVSDCTGGW